GMHMAGDVITSQPIQKDYQLLSYLGRVNVSLLERTGECLLLAPYAGGRAEETAEELLRRARLRPWDLAGAGWESRMAVFEAYDACGSRSESIAVVFKS
ncbi:MAG: hypothetical protein KH305_01545, partial [Sutterella wadsworthensis]|nr:hypothetical protein [Sutterella wadsworthensis]